VRGIVSVELKSVNATSNQKPARLSRGSDPEFTKVQPLRTYGLLPGELEPLLTRGLLLPGDYCGSHELQLGLVAEQFFAIL